MISVQRTVNFLLAVSLHHFSLTSLLDSRGSLIFFFFGFLHSVASFFCLRICAKTDERKKKKSVGHCRDERVRQGGCGWSKGKQMLDGEAGVWERKVRGVVVMERERQWKDGEKGEAKRRVDREGKQREWIEWKTWSQLMAPSFHGNTSLFPPTRIFFLFSFPPLRLTHFFHTWFSFQDFFSVSIIMLQLSIFTFISTFLSFLFLLFHFLRLKSHFTP